MKIPERVKIGPYTYRVERVPGLRDDEDRNLPLHGDVDTAKKLIRLDADDPPEQQFTTLIHECIHALDCDFLKLGLSEKQVKRLGVGLGALLLESGLLGEEAPIVPYEGEPPLSHLRLADQGGNR